MNPQFGKLVLLLCFLATALFVDSAAAQNPNDLLVVGNKNLPVSTVSLEELRSIFLKRKTVWPGGTQIKPIHAEKNSVERRIFSDLVIGMAPEDELRYWENQSVRFSIGPPQQYPIAKYERLRMVFGKTGAISYVLRKDYLEGVVKILLVIPDRR